MPCLMCVCVCAGGMGQGVGGGVLWCDVRGQPQTHPRILSYLLLFVNPLRVT